jgi:hypothetical protein
MRPVGSRQYSSRRERSELSTNQMLRANITGWLGPQTPCTGDRSSRALGRERAPTSRLRRYSLQRADVGNDGVDFRLRKGNRRHRVGRCRYQIFQPLGRAGPSDNGSEPRSGRAFHRTSRRPTVVAPSAYLFDNRSTSVEAPTSTTPRAMIFFSIKYPVVVLVGGRNSSSHRQANNPW